MAPESLRLSWHTLETWLRQHLPATWKDLNPGATDAEIQELAQATGLELPESFWLCWALRNGQQGMAEGVIGGWHLLSCQQMATQYGIWKDLYDQGTFEDNRGRAYDPEVRSDWYNPQWLPITHDGAGNHHCLDLAPSSVGTLGQVIVMYHDDESRHLEAPSLEAWLERICAELTAGRYGLDEHGRLEPYGFFREP